MPRFWQPCRWKLIIFLQTLEIDWYCSVWGSVCCAVSITQKLKIARFRKGRKPARNEEGWSCCFDGGLVGLILFLYLIKIADLWSFSSCCVYPSEWGIETECAGASAFTKVASVVVHPLRWIWHQTLAVCLRNEWWAQAHHSHDLFDCDLFDHTTLPFYNE